MHSAWLSVLDAWIVRHEWCTTDRELFHVEQINMHQGPLAAGRASLTTGRGPRAAHLVAPAAHCSTWNNGHAPRNAGKLPRKTGRELGKFTRENGPRTAGLVYPFFRASSYNKCVNILL